jgi:hypothetical protein
MIYRITLLHFQEKGNRNTPKKDAIFLFIITDYIPLASLALACLNLQFSSVILLFITSYVVSRRLCD